MSTDQIPFSPELASRGHHIYGTYEDGSGDVCLLLERDIEHGEVLAYSPFSQGLATFLESNVRMATKSECEAAGVEHIKPSTGFDLIKHLYRQREFSLRTFGDGARTQGVIDHIRKELIEIEDKPHDVFEWIDVVLLDLDGAWRAGYSPEAIANAISTKQLKNENRQWPDWRTTDPNKAIEHISLGD